MLGDDIILESAVSDLVKKLPSLEKHDYDTIDTLMRKIAKKHHITGKALHDLFVKKFDRTPDDWIKNKLDEALVPGKENRYGSKAKQVKAFIHYIRSMTPEQWEPVIEALRQTTTGEQASAFSIARDAAWLANTHGQVKRAYASGKETSSTAPREAWMIAAPAAVEIQGADEMRRAGHPFYFLPMFGFASPEEIPQDNILKTPKARPKIDWERLDEDDEDEDWHTDPMKWHGGRNDPGWYDMYKTEPLKVKVRLWRGTGTYTVRNFEKISPTVAEITYKRDGMLGTQRIDFDNISTYRDRQGYRNDEFSFYCGSMPITARQAFNLFQTKLHDKTPKTPQPEAPGTTAPRKSNIKWEPLDEDGSELDLQNEVDKFVDWSVKRLHIKSKPAVELSMDTEEAQTNHHTGGHVDGDDSIWVYAKNRNLVDILRTVFHELVHVRQGELEMIRPGSSYPGSPIEAMADMLAGKYIKIYGEKNHHIFQ